MERFRWRYGVGDKVMQTENEYDKEVFNGDMGVGARINPEERELVIAFDGRDVVYGYDELETFAGTILLFDVNPVSLMTHSHTSVLESPSLLSEESLLQSSPADYMNSEQLNFFRNRLLALTDEITRNALATAEQLREAEAPSDEADRATLEEKYTLAPRVRNREDKLLKKIEAALHCIEDGSYGYCEETGEPIGLPRLLARPTTTLSIEARSGERRRQKLFAA